jgi:hypothetical protein
MSHPPPISVHKRAMRGGLAGLVATVPMTIVMVVMQRLLPGRQRNQELPFVQVTRQIESKMPVPNHRLAKIHSLLVAGGHFGFGALCGAIYTATLSRRFRAPARGPTFGVLVWAMSYMGWLPALGLRRPAGRDSFARNAQMVVAHLIWGFVLQTALPLDPAMVRQSAVHPEAAGTAISL